MALALGLPESLEGAIELAPAPPLLATPLLVTAAETETLGMQALTEGRAAEAIDLLVRAAREYLLARDDAGALSVLANLAFVHRQRGELARALELVNQALTLPAPPTEVPLALVNCAGVLDRAVDRRAKGVWMLAAQGFVGKQPLMQVACLAHAIGADLAHDAPGGLPAARALLAQVAPGAPASMVAGFVGAIGDSAGPKGLPFLAQAVWVLARDASAFTASNQPHWAALLEQVDATGPLIVPLCALGLGAVLGRQGEKDGAALSSGVNAVFDACARARGVDAQAFANLVKEGVASLGELPGLLAALVPAGAWVLPPPWVAQAN